MAIFLHVPSLYIQARRTNSGSVRRSEGNEVGVMSGLTKLNIALLGIVALLSSVPGASARPPALPDGPFVEDMSQAIVPLPPPPPSTVNGTALEITPTMRAMFGQWRLIKRDDVLIPKKARYDFVLWGNVFMARRGCLQTSGQLIALADGTVRIDHYTGTSIVSCKSMRAGEGLAPFDGPTSKFDVRGDDLFALASDKRFQFRRVITDTGRASDDFMRGEWLLATLDGNPLRGAEKTSLSFAETGNSIDAAHCDYWSNAAYPAENFRIRLGGSQHMVTTDCKASSLGDKWAKAPDAYELIAVPVDARMELRRYGKPVATLIPAARFPELAASAKSVAADAWSKQLADFVKQVPNDQKLPTIGRILSIDASASGAGGAISATLEAQAVANAIIVVAQLEGTTAVDRGDGLSLDYLYRVKQSWRSDRRPGDILIVRMPPMLGKSRSPYITPEIGANVLLQASRSDYLAGRLREGQPPSYDRRVVAMTLPVMRVEAGRLALATPFPDIPGAQAWRGLTLDEAKRRVAAVDADAPKRSDAVRRNFIIAIDGKPLPNPTWLWLDFDYDKPVKNSNRASGAVTAWSDGCNVTHFSNEWWVSTDIGCGQEKILPIMQELIGHIERDGMPGYMILASGGGSESEIGPYSIPDITTANHRFELREGLK
jgi:hypothetical protein